MAGIVVPIVDYQTFEFSFSGEQSHERVVVAPKVAVTPYTVLGLSVRVHSLSAAPGASIQFVIEAVNPSDRDDRDFLGPVLGSTASDAINEATCTPALVELSPSAIVNPQSPYIRVSLEAHGSAKSGDIRAILSGDLVLKGA